MYAYEYLPTNTENNQSIKILNQSKFDTLDLEARALTSGRFPHCNSRGGAGAGCKVVRLVTCTPYRRSVRPVVCLIEDGQHLSLGVYRRGHLPDGPLATAARERRGTVATGGRRVRGADRRRDRQECQRREKKGLKEGEAGGLERGLCSVPLSCSSQPCWGNSPSERLPSGTLFPGPPQRNFHDTGRQRQWTSLCAIAHRGAGRGCQREPCRE